VLNLDIVGKNLKLTTVEFTKLCWKVDLVRYGGGHFIVIMIIEYFSQGIKYCYSLSIEEQEMKPVQGQRCKILLDYFSSKDTAVGN